MKILESQLRNFSRMECAYRLIVALKGILLTDSAHMRLHHVISFDQ